MLVVILVLVLFIIIYIITHNVKEYNFNNKQKQIHNKLYKIMDVFDMLCRKNKIKYWIDSGTLLGAVRHKAIIPWDDDLDVCINLKDEKRFLEFKTDLNKLGYNLTKSWGSYKIFSNDGEIITDKGSNWVWKKPDGTIVPKKKLTYKFPFMDIYTVDTTKNTCGYFDEHAKAQYPKFYHKRNDLFPLKKYTLGKMKVHGPKNPMPYLNRCYPEWCKKGIMQYDHLNRKFMNVEVMRF
jgi:lipopolysaccharide cholinephosphotransferase